MISVIIPCVDQYVSPVHFGYLPLIEEEARLRQLTRHVTRPLRLQQLVPEPTPT